MNKMKLIFKTYDTTITEAPFKFIRILQMNISEEDARTLTAETEEIRKFCEQYDLWLQSWKIENGVLSLIVWDDKKHYDNFFQAVSNNESRRMLA